MMEALMDWLKPEIVVAIGNDAHKALTELGYPCQYVRHPSYGGQAEFIRGIGQIYGLQTEMPQQGALL
jgi:ABC-type Fe3+-hydroxamate transport system substrate-binding protein